MAGARVGVGSRLGGGVPVPFTGAYASFIAHPYYWRTDASKAVQPSPGDAIRWWYIPELDLWAEQATSGNRPIARYDAVCGWYSEGDGIGKRMVFSLGKTLVTPVTAAVRYKLIDNATVYLPVFGAGSANAIVGPWSFDGTSLYGGFHMNDWRSLNTAASLNICDLNHNTVVAIGENGIAGRVYLNGVGGYNESGASANTFGDEAIIHGAFLDNSSFSSASRVYRACLIESALDAPSRAALTAWLESPNR
jgi:hypothetical protein